MSATGRGAKRADSDFYPTPSWCVDRLLEALPLLPGGRWLEPGAGDGEIMRAVQARADRPPIRNWTAVELRDEGRMPVPGLTAESRWFGGQNFLTFSPAGFAFDVAIGNPPYSLALPFIEKARELSRHVLFLLRLNFLGAARRQPFLAANTPDVYVLPNRPSFADNGKTDATEYAWFHWGPATSGRLQILNLTPKHVRVAARTPSAVQG